ncbi:hypothetical protein GCM10023148_51990 [Actinokineospora soli]
MAPIRKRPSAWKWELQMAIQTGIEATETEFGRLLRRHRERVGLTQRELADLSTISVRAIRDLEQGRARKPRPDTVRLIADGLRLGGQAHADLDAAVDHKSDRSHVVL